MNYREPLPEDCPPETAEEITEQRIVYRPVRHSPPTDADFRSQRAEKPDVKFNTSECQARGLSVFARRSDAEKQSKRRNLRGTAVCRIMLVPGTGRILKTGGSSHYTWWPLAGYDILAHCRMAAI